MMSLFRCHGSGPRSDYFDLLEGSGAFLFSGSGAFFDMKRKIAERARAADPVAPFIDRAGYLHYIDRAEASLRGGQGPSSN